MTLSGKYHRQGRILKAVERPTRRPRPEPSRWPWRVGLFASACFVGMSVTGYGPWAGVVGFVLLYATTMRELRILGGYQDETIRIARGLLEAAKGNKGPIEEYLQDRADSSALEAPGEGGR